MEGGSKHDLLSLESIASLVKHEEKEVQDANFQVDEEARNDDSTKGKLNEQSLRDSGVLMMHVFFFMYHILYTCI